MNAEDVKKTFKVVEFIELPNGAFVSVETFADLFSSASSNPTYDELIGIDGGNLGYIPFFDQCKTDGMLE